MASRNSHCGTRGRGKCPAENQKNTENHVFEDFCMFVLLEILNKMRLVITIFGLWARRQVLHIEISNGRIDFKFVLKQSSYIIVYGKNTFGATVNQQIGHRIFSFIFCNVCTPPSAHLYGDGEMHRPQLPTREHLPSN